MKKGILLFAGVMVFVLLFAGFSAKEAKAADIYSPKEYCEDFINGLSGANSLPGSHYNAIKEQCIVGWTYQNFGATNICYPKLDIYQVVWADNRSGKGYSYSYYTVIRQMRHRLF